ncbi:unnamed protein product [Didymodactylos carnosus]|nr:unnamed protein product [Didymodactylos carnosus]CAF3829236.1 unnamed protein product [Didymodactylos carnosus]
MEHSEDFKNWQYKNNDVHAALISRLEESHQQFPERFPKPGHVLAAVGDIIEGQFAQRLQQESKDHTRERITLIPYNCIEVLTGFQEDGQIKRAEYIDPVNGPSVVTLRIESRQFTKVYPSGVS